MHHNAELLYRELLSELSQLEGTIISPHALSAIESLRSSFLKKFHNDEKDTECEKAALDKFLNCNESCANFALPTELSDDERMVIGEIKSVLYDFFHPAPYVKQRMLSREANMHRHLSAAQESNLLSSALESVYDDRLLTLASIARGFGWGSGASIGSPNELFYSKLVESTMATTNSDLYQLFRLAIDDEKAWHSIETKRSLANGVQIVLGSKLSFVPKSREISRVICTEPTLNMIFQKGVGIVIEHALREVFNISLSTQPDLNRLMARSGSISGEFGTIDLQSASDSISLGLVELLFPSSVVSWLVRCRSPLTVIPDGTKIKLNMISSMGNGYTFPLQTLIFTAVVSSVYKYLNIKLRTNRGLKHGNFGVFGDDIIVVSQAYDLVVHYLNLLGFKVNSDKSFNTGLFRESCGHDYYHGKNIRGVYLKTLHDDADLYSVFNRLSRWSVTNGIPLPRTLQLILTMVRRINYVPLDEMDDSGFKVPFAYTSGLRKDHNGSIVYHALVRVPNIARFPSSWPIQSKKDIKTYQRLVRKLKRFRYCEDGLLQCMLAGYLRAGSMIMRQAGRRTVLHKRVCPGWDMPVLAAGSEKPSQRDIQEWYSLMSLNLEG
jgi:hypothetical protein